MNRWAVVMVAQVCLGGAGALRAADKADVPEEAPARLQTLQARLTEQTRQIESLRRTIDQQEAVLNEMRRLIQKELILAAQSPFQATPTSQTGRSTEVAVDANNSSGVRPGVAATSAIAPLFEQPGVLTKAGTVVVEPSLQYSYSSSNRVALVGYTVIPSILVGVVDVREVKRTSVIGAMTARFGVTNRFEVEGKIPYVYRSDTSVGREILQGTSSSSAFDSAGQSVGDIEMTARYQLNDGGSDRPYYVGSLRLKSRTGKDPFQVMTTKSALGFTNEGIQTQLPTGSGFYGIQPAVTMLYPSDPAVLFGTISYMHSIKRSNVVRRTDAGDESLGTIAPGGIFGFNFGLGLSLNDKSSFSIGYDHGSVGRTRQNGAVAADSVRLQLGTLLLGYSLRLSPERSLNVSLGAGLTRDTPDVTLSLRVPTTF